MRSARLLRLRLFVAEETSHFVLVIAFGFAITIFVLAKVPGVMSLPLVQNVMNPDELGKRPSESRALVSWCSARDRTSSFAHRLQMR